MKIASTLLAVAASTWMLGACADVSSEADDELSADTGSEPDALAQRAPGWPWGRPTGTTTPSGSSAGAADAGRNPITFPNSSPTTAPDAAKPAARDAGTDAGRNPITFPNASPQPTTPPPTTTPPPPAQPPATQPPATQQPTSAAPGTVTVRDPNGLYFANVTARGLGCPSGSWAASISPDGQTFTLTFSRYELQVAPAEEDDSKQVPCTINVSLNSPAGLSYAVTSFYYQGTAVLDPGVRASLSAYYSFPGQRVSATVDGSPLGVVKEDIYGPYDKGYLFEDNLRSSDYVYSECGTTRVLQIVTKLSLENTTPRRNGYVNLAALDGSTRGSIVLKFATRACRPQ